MVTLKEIALRCGCSIATVSKALNGLTDISAATTQRVRDTAAQMGYLPNVAARTLKTNQSCMVGLLMFLRNTSVWSHDYFGHIAQSIQTVLNAGGYDITPVDCDKADAAGGYLDYCRHRNYDGLILMSAGFTEQRLMELVQSDMPVVTIDYAVDNRGAVLSDNVGGIRDMVTYIHEMGHERIAFIHGEDTNVTAKRLASFYATCDALGIHVPEEYVIASTYHDPAASEEATCRLLALPQPPSCILYPDDYSLIGGTNILRDRGLRVPEDISIAGYDGIPLASMVRPALTTVYQDSDAIGRKAARLLLDAIERPRSFIPEHVTLPCSFIPGQTVGKPH